MSYTLERSDLVTTLAGDDEVAKLLSTQADIEAMVRFEVALAEACAACGFTDKIGALAVATAAKNFRPDRKKLAQGMARDGVIVPELVRQLRAGVISGRAEDLHIGATSQDVIDTSMVLRLKAICELLAKRLSSIVGRIRALEKQFGGNAIHARTRMQIAKPAAARERSARWRKPLEELAKMPEREKLKWFAVQLGGPAGNLDGYGRKGLTVAGELAKRLGLSSPADNWQTDRGRVVIVAGWLSQLTGALGKAGADICLMAQNEIGEVELAGAGGSSSMAHKRNPVKAEILVALARYNATLLSALHQSLVHEQERSGAAWTLEWLALPQMCLTAGAATRIADEMFQSIASFGREKKSAK